MRLSSLVRVLENQVINVAVKTASISKSTYNAAEAEYRAQQLVKAALKSQRDALLLEARDVIAATDALKTARENGTFQAELDAFRTSKPVRRASRKAR